jgi:hypothetical protein
MVSGVPVGLHSKKMVIPVHPGYGKNLSRIQGVKNHRILDPDPQHCLICFALIFNWDTPDTILPEIRPAEYPAGRIFG